MYSVKLALTTIDMKKFSPVAFFISVIGFTMAAIIYCSSMFHYFLLDRFGWLNLLHVLVFIVFVPMVFYLNKQQEAETMSTTDSIETGFINSIQSKFKIHPAFPAWVVILFITCYAVSAISVCMFLFNPTQALLMDGKYVLYNHGSITRNITEAEYYTFKGNDERGWSGGWMLFYLYALLQYYAIWKYSGKHAVLQ